MASIRSGNPINEAEYGALSSMTSILGRMCTYSGKEIKWDDATQQQINLLPEKFSFDAAPPVARIAFRPNSSGVTPEREFIR